MIADIIHERMKGKHTFMENFSLENSVMSVNSIG